MFEGTYGEATLRSLFEIALLQLSHHQGRPWRIFKLHMVYIIRVCSTWKMPTIVWLHISVPDPMADCPTVCKKHCWELKTRTVGTGRILSRWCSRVMSFSTHGKSFNTGLEGSAMCGRGAENTAVKTRVGE